MIVLWTDGSASPNPGPGGYAVIRELEDGSGRPVRLGREKKSTNIRMEAFALIEAIKYAHDLGESCEIHTDSEFWINVLTKWAPNWKARNWTKAKGQIKNLELVQQLYKLYSNNVVDLIWVRGHVGTKLNELADKWANKARRGATLPDEPKPDPILTPGPDLPSIDDLNPPELPL